MGGSRGGGRGGGGRFGGRGGRGGRGGYDDGPPDEIVGERDPTANREKRTAFCFFALRAWCGGNRVLRNFVRKVEILTGVGEGGALPTVV